MTIFSPTCTAFFKNFCLCQTVFQIYIYRYKCCFHVQEYNLNSVAETQEMITSALASQYDDGSVSIQITKLIVNHIGESKSVPPFSGGVGFWTDFTSCRASKLPGRNSLDCLRGVYMVWNISPSHPRNGLQKATIRAGLQAVVRPRPTFKMSINCYFEMCMAVISPNHELIRIFPNLI